MLSMVLLLVILTATFASSEQVTYVGYRVFQVALRDDASVAALDELRDSSGVDIWRRTALPERTADVMVAPDTVDNFTSFLRDRNLSATILVEDVERILENERSLMIERRMYSPAVTSRISFDRFYTYDEIVSYLKNLAKRYPSLMSVSYPGTSYEGRPIAMATISSGGGGTRKAIIVEAGIHAREWLAPAAALYIINQLVENYTANAALTDNVDWLILPVLNPDGYEYTFTTNRLWRKTRSSVPDSKCLGTDGNRNFDFFWGGAGVSTDPCKDNYLGTKPFSESETRTLRDVSLSKKGRIGLFLSVHTYGSYIVYPWSYKYKFADNWKQLDYLANKANAANVRAGGKSYTVGNSAKLMYPTSGSSDDWNMGKMGVPLVYTVELPGGGRMGFDLPAHKILSHTVPFFEAVRVFGDYVAKRA